MPNAYNQPSDNNCRHIGRECLNERCNDDKDASYLHRDTTTKTLRYTWGDEITRNDGSTNVCRIDGPKEVGTYRLRLASKMGDKRGETVRRIKRSCIIAVECLCSSESHLKVTILLTMLIAATRQTIQALKRARRILWFRIKHGRKVDVSRCLVLVDDDVGITGFTTRLFCGQMIDRIGPENRRHLSV